MDSYQAREIEAGDPLGYDLFASALARSILNVNAEESIVYGLSGEWGSGKSSILKTVATKLERAEKAGDGDEAPPMVVRFNPWWFSGTEVLALEFFKALWGRIGSDFKGQFKEVLAFFRPFAAPITGAIAYYVSGGNAEVAGKSEPFARMLEGVLDGYGKLLEDDTAAAKERIAKDLRKKKQRVVVIIDELDRLLPSEIIQVLRLIRAVADLPYVLYLVAFEEEAVLAALAKEGIREPSDYLEKMFQLRLTVPRATAAQLEKLVAERLLKWVDVDVNSFKGGNDRRWTAAFRLALRDEFTTPRDVVRFVNHVKTTYPAVKEHVNVVDFLILGALRTLDPRLDRQIQGNRTLLLQAPADMIEAAKQAVTRDVRQEKTVVAEFFPGISDPRAQAVRELFPKFRAALSGKNVEEFFIHEDRFGRIWDPASFEAYFRLSPAEGQLTRREIEELLGGDPKVLAQRIRSRWSEDERATADFVEYLRGWCGEENQRGSATLLRALLEIEEEGFHRNQLIATAFDTVISVMMKDARTELVEALETGGSLDATARAVTRHLQDDLMSLGLPKLVERIVTSRPEALLSSWARGNIRDLLQRSGGFRDPRMVESGVGVMLALRSVQVPKFGRSNVEELEAVLGESRIETERRVRALLAKRPEWWSEAETSAAEAFLHDQRQLPASPMLADELGKEENGNDAASPGSHGPSSSVDAAAARVREVGVTSDELGNIEMER